MMQHPWIEQFERLGPISQVTDAEAADQATGLMNLPADSITFVPVLPDEVFVVAQQQPLSVVRVDKGWELVALTRGDRLKRAAINEQGEWVLPFRPFWVRLLPFIPDLQRPTSLVVPATNDHSVGGSPFSTFARELAHYRQFGHFGTACDFVADHGDRVINLDEWAISELIASPPPLPFAACVLLEIIRFSWRKNLRQDERHCLHPVDAQNLPEVFGTGAIADLKILF